MPRGHPKSAARDFETFFEREDRSQIRHEYVGGLVYERSGRTGRHDKIVTNVSMRLVASAQTRGGFVPVLNVLLKTPSGDGYYPDAFVVLESGMNSSKIQKRPCVIVEVFAEETEAVDRGEKLRNYRTIPTLDQYVLLNQNQVLADVYSKQPEGWWRHEILSAGSTIRFSSLDLDVPLDALYENLPEIA